MLETEWRQEFYNKHREMSTYAIIELREGHRTLQMVKGYRVFTEEIRPFDYWLEIYNVKGSSRYEIY